MTRAGVIAVVTHQLDSRGHTSNWAGDLVLPCPGAGHFTNPSPIATPVKWDKTRPDFSGLQGRSSAMYKPIHWQIRLFLLLGDHGRPYTKSLPTEARAKIYREGAVNRLLALKCHRDVGFMPTTSCCLSLLPYLRGARCFPITERLLPALRARLLL
jgi:hypothetical protein